MSQKLTDTDKSSIEITSELINTVDLNRRPSLLDRDCVWFDGHCDCPYEEVVSYGLKGRRPICKKYNKKEDNAKV